MQSGAALPTAHLLPGPVSVPVQPAWHQQCSYLGTDILAEPHFTHLISCAAGGRLPRTTNPRPQAAGADMSGCRVDWA